MLLAFLTMVTHWSRSSSIIMLWLLKIWQVGSRGKFMHYLETCLVIAEADSFVSSYSCTKWKTAAIKILLLFMKSSVVFCGKVLRFETMIWPSIMPGLKKRTLKAFTHFLTANRAKTFWRMLVVKKESFERYSCLEFILKKLQTPEGWFISARFLNLINLIYSIFIVLVETEVSHIKPIYIYIYIYIYN